MKHSFLFLSLLICSTQLPSYNLEPVGYPIHKFCLNNSKPEHYFDLLTGDKSQILQLDFIIC